MMNMRGGLLALLVLGIATILMVFFVLPNIGSDKEATAPTPVAETKPAATPAAPAAPAVDVAAATAAASAKMARLMGDAESAVKGLADLFAESKIPGAETFATARGAAEAALGALAEAEIPVGIESAATEQITKARAGASRALGLLKALPTDPAAAAVSIQGIVAALSGAEAATTANAAPVPPASPAAAPDAAIAMPKFDVLRVEPDGSTVIAGSAQPGSKLEIVNGDKVISTVDVGATGDFAAVLDNPLPAGDHAISLRASVGNGQPVTSDEVATVSVPEKSGGQLLAMISKPGEASRVITMPESVNTEAKQERVAEANAAPATDGTAPAEGVKTPDLPQGSAALANTAPTITSDAPAAPATAPATSGDAATAEIKVTAVEIEGGRIFIAGTAPPERRVRGYANETVVGEAETDGSSHFVIEGQTSLPVGQHTIHVDLLDSTGKVAVRASVPFNRPAGEQVAVVASDPALDRSAFDTQRDAVSKALGLLKGLYADGKMPTVETLAAGRSATEIALKSLSEFQPTSAGLSAAAAERVGAVVTGSAKALAALQALPRDVEAFGKGLPAVVAMIEELLDAPAAPAPQESASAAGAAPKTIAQAPLKESRESVIIRQGDTLWQISRRVYGQGVRYTTIYLANEDQIINPDLIEPGQIFNVPSEALPNAEELHRRHMRGERMD